MRRRTQAILLVSATLWPNVHAEELPTLTLVAKGGSWEPRILQAPSGIRFRLIIKNLGPGSVEFESRELRKEKVLSEGAESFLIFAPLHAGTYEFFDEFHPQGAAGQIIVRP